MKEISLEREAELTEYLNHITYQIFGHTRPKSECKFTKLSENEQLTVKLTLVTRKTYGEFDDDVHEELIYACNGLSMW